MVKKLAIVLIGVTMLLCGCGKQEEEVVSEPVPVSHLHEPTESIVWNNMLLNGITPVTSFESTDDTLTIFPYYDNDAHITVRKIIISDNAFWNSVISQYIDSDNIKYVNDYALVTNTDGKSFGYIGIDEKTAYIISTDTLPSAYVESTLKLLCNTNT